MILLIMITILAVFGIIIFFVEYKNKKPINKNKTVIKYNTRGNVRCCLGLVTGSKEFDNDRNSLKGSRF